MMCTDVAVFFSIPIPKSFPRFRVRQSPPMGCGASSDASKPGRPLGGEIERTLVLIKGGADLMVAPAVASLIGATDWDGCCSDTHGKGMCHVYDKHKANRPIAPRIMVSGVRKRPLSGARAGGASASAMAFVGRRDLRSCV